MSICIMQVYIYVRTYVHKHTHTHTHTHTCIRITGKLYAFRGPVDDGFRLPGQQVPPGTLKASAYVDLFRKLDISTVIQLNEPQYDRCRARSGRCLPTCNAMMHRDDAVW